METKINNIKKSKLFNNKQKDYLFKKIERNIKMKKEIQIKDSIKLSENMNLKEKRLIKISLIFLETIGEIYHY